MEEKWYVVTLIIGSRIEGIDGQYRTCDEQIHILRAPNIKSAYEKAVQIGHMEEHSYQNMNGQTVYWEFIGLVDLEEMVDSDIKDGAEIKSRLFKMRDPSRLIRSKDDLTVFKWERERLKAQQSPTES